MSKFQLKKLSLACGMAIGAVGFAGNASAVDLFLAGATAQDINLSKAVFDLCDTAQPRTRILSTGVGSTFLCTGSATSGLSGQPIVVSKQIVGGSANGVKPVNNNSALLVDGVTPMLRPATSTAGCTAGVDPNGIWPTFFTCATNAGAAAPHAGLSDVEPRLLANAANEYNFLAPAGTVAVQFAPALSVELYKKLQDKQGKTVGDFSEAQAPSIQPAELRGILNGTLVDWTQMYPTIGVSPVGGANAPDGTPQGTAVKLCRRGTASGTQKTFEVRMLQLGCAGAGTQNSGALNSIVDNTGDGFSNGAQNNDAPGSVGTALGQGGYRGRTNVWTVVMNNGSGDVGTCMNDANNQGEMAIGLISKENVPPAGWKFAKMGDTFPNLANMINGTWDNLWSQATFQRRSAASPAPAYSADQNTLMDKLTSGIGNPANISGIPLLGVAGLPSNGYTWDGTLPLVRGERRDTAGVVNNCQDALFQ